MTAPLEDIVPLKYKAYVGLVGSFLTFIVPSVVEYTANLDQPWPTIIGAVVALLTALGVYKAPYKPGGTVIAPAEVPAPTMETSGEYRPGDDYQNPWKQQ